MPLAEKSHAALRDIIIRYAIRPVSGLATRHAIYMVPVTAPSRAYKRRSGILQYLTVAYRCGGSAGIALASSPASRTPESGGYHSRAVVKDQPFVLELRSY